MAVSTFCAGLCVETPPAPAPALEEVVVAFLAGGLLLEVVVALGEGETDSLTRLAGTAPGAAAVAAGAADAVAGAEEGTSYWMMEGL